MLYNNYYFKMSIFSAYSAVSTPSMVTVSRANFKLARKNHTFCICARVGMSAVCIICTIFCNSFFLERATQIW